MSKRLDRDSLSDMREAIYRILSYTEGFDYQDFLEDTKTQDAVIRNLEIMGEATKNLSQRVRDQYANVPWRSMAGVRDRLIHNYFGINLDIVWQIIVAELPKVARNLDEILEKGELD